MKAFDKFIGNNDAKAYFTKTINKDQLSHSYIFEGPYGVGKNTFALEVAKFILCENKQGERPCGECTSCHMIESGNHPDVTLVEKDTKITKVDTIREQIVQNIEIKPYRSDYKIIIIKSADSISVQGQNALLKTIEEPPSYGIIILICENMATLLPTIKSRCITVRFNPLSQEEVSYYLEQRGVYEEQKEVLTKLSEGSIGRLQDILENEEYLELRKQSISYLDKLGQANLVQLYELVKEIGEEKENLEQILSFWLLWYRDIVVIKTAKSTDLYYPDYHKQLLDMSQKLTYNKVNQNIEHIKTSILDIRQNVNSTFIIENLLLKLKERKK